MVSQKKKLDRIKYMLRKKKCACDETGEDVVSVATSSNTALVTWDICIMYVRLGVFWPRQSGNVQVMQRNELSISPVQFYLKKNKKFPAFSAEVKQTELPAQLPKGKRERKMFISTETDLTTSFVQQALKLTATQVVLANKTWSSTGLRQDAQFGRANKREATPFTGIFFLSQMALSFLHTMPVVLYLHKITKQTTKTTIFLTCWQDVTNQVCQKNRKILVNTERQWGSLEATYATTVNQPFNMDKVGG